MESLVSALTMQQAAFRQNLATAVMRSGVKADQQATTALVEQVLSAGAASSARGSVVDVSV